MPEIGYGYGSEWHLLRYLGRHRHALNHAIETATGGQVTGWLDYPFNPRKRMLDDEWKGLDFLPEDHPARIAWKEWWPQSGVAQNWDAIGKLSVNGETEWLLVEAKAHIAEIISSCGAKEEGGLPRIRAALDETKQALGISSSSDWLQSYYQYGNRLAVLHFLAKHNIPARLLFIYFCGDSNPNAECPKDEAGWKKCLDKMYRHLGINDSTHKSKVSKVFLGVVDNKIQ